MSSSRRILAFLAAAVTTLGGLAVATAPAAHATFKTEPRLVFIRCGAVCDLYSMKTDGTGVKQITHQTSGNDVDFGHISPDGKMVVMEIGDDIYTANIDGSHMRNITKTASSYEYDPSFSPDGKKVIYINYPTGQAGRLETRNIDGSGKKSFFKNDGVDEPVFSPDGKWIATTGETKSGDEEIYVMHADGSGVVRVTHRSGYDYMGTWSPDGSRISWYGDSNIFTARPDGTHMQQLTSSGNIGYAPWYTPDGKRIYYSDNTSGTSHIYSMDTSGGHIKQLTASGSNDYVIGG